MSDLSNLDILRAADERARAEARQNFAAYIRYTFPEYEFGWFNELLAAEIDQFLDDVEAGKMPRLMVFAPPRSGKSEQCSRRLPSYALGKHPEWNIISTSYSADLANRMSRDTQRIIETERYGKLFPDTRLNNANVRTMTGRAVRTVELWETIDSNGAINRGAYRAAGVNGGITGQGANIGIIDDPTKDFKQAASSVYQEAVKDWYDTTFYTRLDPKKNGIIIILTRWHMNDLAGKLLEEAQNDGEQWRVVSFPMVAEADEYHTLNGVKYYLRKPGEILFPERMPAEFVAKCRLRGSLVWNALYQQRPTPKGGSLIKSEWFGEYDKLPPLQYRIITADTAQKTKEANDYSVFQHWGLGKDGYLYLIDQIRGKWESDELKRRAKAFWLKAKIMKNGRLRYMAIEDKVSGTSLIQQLRNLASPKIPLKEIPRNVDKLTRLLDNQGYIETGYIKLPADAPWLNDFLIECESITREFNTHDDQVDPMLDAIDLAIDKNETDIFEVVK